jgi:hypothetical protein
MRVFSATGLAGDLASRLEGQRPAPFGSAADLRGETVEQLASQPEPEDARLVAGSEPAAKGGRIGPGMSVGVGDQDCGGQGGF